MRIISQSAETQRPRRLVFPCLTVGLSLGLGGCAYSVLDPAGPVARSDRTILLDSLAIMLVIVIPTIVATLVIAWWFRAGNKRATYLPDWSYSGRLELVVWSVPLMIVLFLGGVGWVGAHDLDPAKPIAVPGKAAVQPLDVDVVSLDWKWLFIYPDQGIASVNRLVIPAGVPVRFRLTSASVMNSFFVPRLGSQIYAMAGMATRLNLEADQPGSYEGISAQFSGGGFSDMKFAVDAMSPADFAKWAAAAHKAGPALDDTAYRQLAKPSQADAASTFRGVPPDLFEKIVDWSAQGSGQMSSGQMASSAQ